jgi:hypothetical protein
MERNQAEKALAEALGAVAVSAGFITAATYGIAKVACSFWARRHTSTSSLSGGGPSGPAFA